MDLRQDQNGSGEPGLVLIAINDFQTLEKAGARSIWRMKSYSNDSEKSMRNPTEADIDFVAALFFLGRQTWSLSIVSPG